MSALSGPAAFDVLALLVPSDELEGMHAVLSSLPFDLPVPVLVVSPSEERFPIEVPSRATPLPVQWAEEGAVVRAGRVYVCPPRTILEVRPPGRCAVTPSEDLRADRPLDRLLASLAVSFGARALTVILGGRGRDGVTGALALRGAGGTILVQDSAAHASELARATLEAGAVDAAVATEALGRTIDDFLAGRAPRPSERDWTERRAEGVLERMSDAYCVLDRDFRVRRVNAAAERLLGVPRASLLGRSHREVVPGSADAPVEHAYRRVVEEGVEQHFTHHYVGEGHDLHLEVDAYPTDEGGVALFWRNVTERVRAEAALRASEEKYRALFNEMDEAYAIVEVTRDAEGRWTDFLFLEVNSAFMRHTGMPYPVGRAATQLLGTPNPRWAQLYGRAVDSGEPIRVEETELTLGRVFDLNIFRLGAEGSRRVAVLFTDVTERKRAEAALSESERRYRLLFESMNEGFALAEIIRGEDGRPVDWRYVEVNEAWTQTGVPVGETVGRTAREVNPLIEPGWIETYGRVVDTGQPVTYEAYAQGFGKWFDTVAFKHSENRFGLVFHDVTARKNAEAALKESEERLRLAIDATGLGVSDWDLATDRVVANARFRALFGLPAHSDVLGTALMHAMVHPEDQAWVAASIAEAMKPGATGRFEVEHRALTPDGERWLLTLGQVHFAEEGARRRAVRVIGNHLDITARKHAEADVCASEARQAFLLKLSDALRPLTDPAAIQGEAVRMLGEHLGSDRAYYMEVDEARGEYVVAREWHHGKVSGHARRFPRDAWPMPWLADGNPWVVRNVNTDPAIPDDQRASYRGRDIAACVVVPLVKEGRLVATLVADETKPRDWKRSEVALLVETAERTRAAVERARADAALVESEGRLRALIEHLPGGAVFVVDHDLRYVLAQGEALAAAGFAPHDLTGRTVADVMVPELIADYEARYRQALAGEGFEFEHTAHDRVFLTRGTPLRDAARRVTAALAVSYDITERKRAEEDVRESEARLAAIFEALPVGVGVVNTEGTLLLSNHEMHRFLPTGVVPAPDSARQTRWEGFDAQGRRVEPRDFPGARALRGEKVVPGIDMLYTSDDGSQRWTRVAAVPLRDAAGRVTGQVNVVTDVNALKRAQEELRALNADLERRVAERTRRLADVNAELGNVITRTAHNLEAPARRLGRLLNAGQPVDARALDSLTAEDAMKLQDELTRLRGIAQDLRQLAALEQQDVKKDLLPLGEVFKAVRADVSSTPRGKRVYWQVEPLPIVRGDRALLRQALDVLMTFTLSETRGARYVTVTSREVEGEVQITVEDDGLGLTGEEAATLFDLSVRTDQEVPLLEGGGLVQVRRILARHGGWVWAEALRSSGKVVLAFPKDDAVNEMEALFREDRLGE